jgi:type IV pilus assembly protein PilM
VMTRLHGEINRSINFYRSQQKGRKPEKLYLAGGSSVMAFTPRFFSEKLRIPVEYFNPFQVVSLAPAIDKEHLAEVAHMFSEVIGLGLRFVTVCPIEISLVPEAIKRQNELKAKLPYFYASAASILLCLFITFWGFSKQESVSNQKLMKAQKVVNDTNNMLSMVNRARGELQEVEKRYFDAKAILDDRKIWIGLMNEIQAQLPDQMWLSKVRGSATGGSAGATSNPAAGGMPGGGIFDPFGGGNSSRRQNQAASSASTIEWIVLEGHSYVAKDNKQLWEESLMNSLTKSKLFSERREDMVTISLEPARGNNNISSFKIEAKLKTPIKKIQ